MPRVRLWFYNPSQDTSGWLNKVVSRLDPPYCHCELQFADDVACSIYMGTAAGMRRRSFDVSSYDCVEVPCTAQEHAAMYATAAAIVAHEVQFSTLRMTGCMLWMPVSDNERFTFCSKLCVDILQSAQVLPAPVEPGKTTPSGLHRLLARMPPRAPPAPVGPCMALDFK